MADPQTPQPGDGVAALLLTAVEHHNAGRLPEAEALYRQILAIDPNHVDALHNLGYLASQVGRDDIAVELIGRATTIDPTQAVAFNNLGNALAAKGAFAEALAAFHRAIALQPALAMAHSNLGNVLRNQGRPDEAAAAHRRALALDPDFTLAHNNLGAALLDLGEAEAAVASFRQALARQPDYPEALSNLGNALTEAGEFEAAVAAYNQALTLSPGNADILFNLGGARGAQGRLAEAEAHYSQALAIRPDHWRAHDNRLFSLNYAPTLSAGEIYQAYAAYEADVAARHRPDWPAHANDRTPVRRLRIGYVSGDFKHHAARHFFQPLIEHHDRAAFETFLYAENFIEDEVSRRYRDHADHWIRTAGLSDPALCERIRADRIDILVDLSGHTVGNRLGVFARKPAPVSLTWLGYGYTTGLKAIDYFLTDAVMAPPGSEPLFSETPWRLEGPGYAYRPAEGMGEPGPLPALAKGHVTFGTLSRAIRINARTVRVWSELLHRVEGSRLLINSKDFKHAANREPLLAQFARQGIGRERLEIGFDTPPWDVMRRIDIGLDCFPHNSGTTLFESLYMGLPFVTLAGRPSVGLLGSTILTGLGRPEWIADSEDAYVEIAAALASDLPALAALRAGLRAEMRAGPLMDEAGFARKVEAAYRQMWARWCEARP